MRTVLRLAATLSLVLLVAACGGSVPAGAAAVVGDQRIPIDLVERIVEAQVANPQSGLEGLTGSERDTRIEEIQRGVLNRLIEIEVIRSIADDRGIEVSDTDLQERFAQEAETAGGEEALADTIASLGLDEQEFREILLAETVLSERLQEDIASEAAPSEEDLRAAYEGDPGRWDQVDLRALVTDDEAAAQAARERIEGGEDFGDVASEVSVDPAAAEDGGDLEPLPRAQLPAEIADPLEGASPGDLVGPIPFNESFFVLLVEDATQVSFEEASETLTGELSQATQDARIAELLTTAHEELDIRVDSRFGEWDPAVGAVVSDEPVPSQGPPGDTGGDVPVPGDLPTDVPVPPTTEDGSGS